MKVKYIKGTLTLCLTHNKIYDVLAIEKDWYKIIDDTGEDYLFPPEYFEIVNLQVKFIGKLNTPALEEDKVYNVLSIEKGWYRIMTELDEDYLFPSDFFEVIIDN